MKPSDLRIDEDLFNKAAETVSEDLSELTASDSTRGLKLTGLEVLGFLAAKVFVPILCAYVKDVLYDKYKNLKTKKEAAEAKQQLLQSAGPFKLQIDPDILIRDLAQSLTAEGVPAELASKTVQHALSYVEKEISATGTAKQEAAG